MPLTTHNNSHQRHTPTALRSNAGGNRTYQQLPLLQDPGEVPQYHQIPMNLFCQRETLNNDDSVFIRTNIRDWFEVCEIHTRVNSVLEQFQLAIYSDEDNSINEPIYLVLVKIPLDSSQATIEWMYNENFQSYPSCSQYYVQHPNRLYVDLLSYPHSSDLVERVKHLLQSKCGQTPAGKSQLSFKPPTNDQPNKLESVLTVKSEDEKLILKLKQIFGVSIREKKQYLRITNNDLQQVNLTEGDSAPRLIRKKHTPATATATATTEAASVVKNSTNTISQYFAHSAQSAACAPESDEDLEILSTADIKQKIPQAASISINYDKISVNKSKLSDSKPPRSTPPPPPPPPPPLSPAPSRSSDKLQNMQKLLDTDIRKPNAKLFTTQKMACRLNENDLQSNYLILRNITSPLSSTSSSPSNEVSISQFSTQLNSDILLILQTNDIQVLGFHQIINEFPTHHESPFVEYLILLQVSSPGQVKLVINLFQSCFYFQNGDKEGHCSLPICVICTESEASVFQKEADVHLNCSCGDLDVEVAKTGDSDGATEEDEDQYWSTADEPLTKKETEEVALLEKYRHGIEGVNETDVAASDDEVIQEIPAVEKQDQLDQQYQLEEQEEQIEEHDQITEQPEQSINEHHQEAEAGQEEDEVQVLNEKTVSRSQRSMRPRNKKVDYKETKKHILQLEVDNDTDTPRLKRTKRTVQSITNRKSTIVKHLEPSAESNTVSLDSESGEDEKDVDVETIQAEHQQDQSRDQTEVISEVEENPPEDQQEQDNDEEDIIFPEEYHNNAEVVMDMNPISLSDEEEN
ncbi:hypothetical protein WICPIJ_008872 [Wickerhamomyces pijperi]|uniref:Uncharacterized protein n=1 Tax=Wickerhamomyces pijperi TaxID=599730 RepID=A0A9P8PVC7_WICPI|nr:hypothetical protein WICPIJ_008872 [Wickerhamomyces pijperi]